MAEPVINSPSIRDIERAIEMEAAKPSPNLAVIKEFANLASTIFESAGVELTPPTTQQNVTTEVSKEPWWKQLAIGAGQTLPRAHIGLKNIFTDTPKQEQKGGFINPVLLEDTELLRQATPLTKLGNIGGDFALGAGFPAAALRHVPLIKNLGMQTRIGQAVDTGVTGAAIQSAIAPEDKAIAAAFGSLGAAAPALMGAVQRGLPSVAGGVSRQQVAGENLLREVGPNAENLISRLKQDYNLVPGVTGSSAVVSQHPYLRTLETGSRVGSSQNWLPFDETNAAARLARLMQLSGSPAERDAWTFARNLGTTASRESAQAAATIPGGANAPVALSPVMQSLSTLASGEQRGNPAVQKIVKYVGGELGHEGGITPQQLYTVRKVLTGQIKTGLNDEIGNAAAAARR